MRALVISLLTLGLLIGGWLWFYQYSVSTLHSIVSACEEDVMSAIEDDRWEDAYNSFATQYQAWRRYEKRALLMLETDKINEVNMNFAKTLMYIKAKDLSNSSGELLALEEALKQLHKNESLSLENIL